MSNRTPKSRTRSTRTRAKAKAAPVSDRGLEERITERLDRESLARLQVSSARPAAFPEHLGELVLQRYECSRIPKQSTEVN